jgi:hypothetical protein
MVESRHADVLDMPSVYLSLTIALPQCLIDTTGGGAKWITSVNDIKAGPVEQRPPFHLRTADGGARLRPGKRKGKSSPWLNGPPPL